MTADAPLPPSLVAANLRRLAKERLYMGSPPTDLAPLSSEEVLHLMHELQVKQIELEIQNEELQTSQAKERAAALRYADHPRRALRARAVGSRSAVQVKGSR